jgi:hypothetical protein
MPETMLKKVISQLSGEQFGELQNELASNRGEKFSQLLNLYRENDDDDGDIKNKIGVNNASFYTLKSRLSDKIQQYLFRTASDHRAELLKNISSIPQLIYNTPRETAIMLLEHLELELKKNDMPDELVSVYNALKKLHLHSESYYHYQQLYNKNVAYTLSLDKADELVSSFNRELGEYLLSRDVSKIDILRLYLKELSNLGKLYDSHRLKVYRLIASITYALFIEKDIPETEETIEDLLKQFDAITEEHPEDRNYKHLVLIRHFQNFIYYHQLGLHKNGTASFEKLNANPEKFLLLAHTCPASYFLIIKAERAVTTSAGSKTAEEPKSHFQVSNEDVFSTINCTMYEAAVAFHKQQYTESASILNGLINEVSFKNFPFAEFEVKLFLAISQLMCGKTEQAELTLRSVSRKLASAEFSKRFPSTQAFCRFLKIALNDSSSQKGKKLQDAYAAFKQVNSGSETILSFLPLDASHLNKLI